MTLNCIVSSDQATAISVVQGSHLLFIDRSVDNYQSLIAGAIVGIEVIELDTYQDGVQQITQALTQRQDVSSLHIVSHGAPGRVFLGNTELSIETLNTYAQDLQAWAAALAVDAEVLIYGCEVGKGDRGLHLIHQLSEQTGARIAASTTKTGHASQGGDWNLEIATASIHSTLAFTPATLSRYEATLSDEFLVTPNSWGNSSVTALTDGGFVVIWSNKDQFMGGSGIYGQRYDVQGNANGPEFRIDSITNDPMYSWGEPSPKTEPSVTALADGGFVVTWTSLSQEPESGYFIGDIYGRRYDAQGTASGSEVLINTTTALDQIRSSVTALADGGFVVTWTSVDQVTRNNDIYGQRYDAAGSAIGSEFRINSVTENDQFSSSVAALEDGGFVVTWTFWGQDGSNLDIYGQRYDRQGNAAGSEFRVNTFINGDQSSSSVTGLADGGFVVTWTFWEQDGSNDIYGQRYDANGNVAGSEFRVNIVTENRQYSSSVTGLSDGGFVVSWTSEGLSGPDIYGQRYDAAGNAVGSEFLINQATDGSQWNSSNSQGSYYLDTLANGNLVATWYGSTPYGYFGLMARILEMPTLNGAPTGTPSATLANGTEDTAYTINAANLLAGFTDPNGDLLSVANLTATNGTLTETQEGAWIFTPNADFTGTVNLNYNVVDGKGGSIAATQSFTINRFVNIINGTASNDSLVAGIDKDQISANAGNDTVTTTVGNAQQDDLFDGGIGVDTLVVSGGTASMGLSLDVGAANQLSGTPELVVQNFEVFDFSGFQGTLNTTGSAGNDTISSGVGNDNLFGGDGDDSLNGGAGNDTLNGGTGTNRLVGGDGDDFYLVSTSSDIIVEAVNGGIDTVESAITYALGANVEHLILAGTNAINGTGNVLNNSLNGNSSNNVLYGGTGEDTLRGGAGNDRYIVNSVGDTVTEQANEGIDTVTSSIGWTLGSNIENLVLTETAINGTGNSLHNNLTGNNASNILEDDAGNDTLRGGVGNDTLRGGIGNDALIGGTGGDQMVGGIGNDLYSVDSTSDIVIELLNQGTDLVQSSTHWTLDDNFEDLMLVGSSAINGIGNSLSNRLTGNSGNNILEGGAGNDTLRGGAGNDTLRGGIGNDLYSVDSTSDIVIELLNQGTDSVQSSIHWTLDDNFENLMLFGSAAINGTGNSLSNRLTGNSGNNVLNGGDGNDVLVGGTGADTLIGGNGNDVLSLGLRDGAVDVVVYNTGHGSDMIDQFVLGAGGDLLRFNGIASIDVVTSGTSTQFRVGDGISGNNGFGVGALMLTLRGVTGFRSTNIMQNVQAGDSLPTFNFS